MIEKAMGAKDGASVARECGIECARDAHARYNPRRRGSKALNRVATYREISDEAHFLWRGAGGNGFDVCLHVIEMHRVCVVSARKVSAAEGNKGNARSAQVSCCTLGRAAPRLPPYSPANLSCSSSLSPPPTFLLASHGALFFEYVTCDPASHRRSLPLIAAHTLLRASHSFLPLANTTSHLSRRLCYAEAVCAAARVAC